MSQPRPSALSRAKASATARWTTVQAQHPSVAHSLRAWGRFQKTNASQYAAAITYFSFVALFPLLLLAVSVTGFVLQSHPAALHSLFQHVTDKVPGSFGDTLNSSITTAIDNRTSVGVVGLAGVLLAGLGWIGNLRAAIDAVWAIAPPKRNFVMAKVANLLVLAGLGLGVLISVGLTAVGTALTPQILRGLDIEHVTGVHYLATIATLVAAVVGDMIIFWWLLVRVPGAQPPRRVALKGAVLAAVGFEALKLIGTYTIASTAHSPTAGPFAGILAVLIWIQLVARFMLFCAALMAVLTEEAASTVALGAKPAPSQPAALSAEQPAVDSVHISPAAVAASLVGVGAAAGGATVAWVTRRRDDSVR